MKHDGDDTKEIHRFVMEISRMAALLNNTQPVYDIISWITDMAEWYIILPHKNIRVTEEDGINIVDGMDTLFNIIRGVAYKKVSDKDILQGFLKVEGGDQK